MSLITVSEAIKPDTISITLGAVRVATVTTWDEARAIIARDIRDKYASVIRSAWLDFWQRRQDYELDQVAADPIDGVIFVGGPWSWGTDIRTAREGAYGLTAGDLCYVHDYSAGYSSWTIDVKAKIVAVCGDSARPMVRVRVTDWSACQLMHGEIVTVHCDRIRSRKRPVKR